MNYYPIWLYEFMIPINMPEQRKTNKQKKNREDGMSSNLALLLPYVKFEVHAKMIVVLS